ANGNALEELQDTVNRYLSTCTDGSALMLKNIVNLPNTTRACVGSSTSALLKDYIRQKSLTKMLSVSTFDVTKMYEEPTCVFLVIPDETTSYDHIAGLLLDSFYNRLIKQFSETYQNRSNPPCRINYVVDEFCNVHISDMSGKISASRSRDMRWYLFCQSKAQLDRAYEQESATIIGNCKNIVFLQSSDPAMLDYISNLCGKTYVTESSSPVPLISADRLRGLKQSRDFKEGIFIRGSFKYHMMLPDFERYSFRGVMGLRAVSQPDRVGKVHLRCYTPQELIDNLDNKEIQVPFRAFRRRRAS
ncbi:MAG: type IV secretory system conjugative DNA transfer family protein, partial [Oscillospiraceae bacterium]